MTQPLLFGIDQQLIGFGIAFAVAFIIGIEREWAEDKPVGVRSFSLIGALGGMSALLLEPVGAWPIAVGLFALGLILAVHKYTHRESGTTTLIAALIVFLLGAAAVAGYWLHAIVAGGAVTVLLHWKQPLHRWVERLGDRDVEIIVRFVLIALVILPVLPNQTIGPYDVLNPFTTWFLVVLIVGINLVGYVLFRLIGARAGGWVAGLLGGLVSSTATTISYAGMSRREGDLGSIAALVILVASAVVYGRIIVVLAIVAPGMVAYIAGPCIAFTLVLLALSTFAYTRIARGIATEMPEQENPARIRQALAFAALYAVILLAVSAARDLVGEGAVYGVAVISGLTDVDALTLSVARLFVNGMSAPDDAWRVIFLATLSNLAFKVIAASFLGSAMLRRWMLGAGAVALGTGAAILLLWPAGVGPA